MHYFIWRQEFWGFSFRKCFKSIQFYPKGGLTIQLWRTGRFVELDPTLRQSDGSGGWIELKTTEQRYKSYKRMISRWYKGGLKLYMRWFRSNSSWTHSFLFCCCQSFEDSFLSSWLAAGLGWTMVDWPTRWSLYCPLGICIDHFTTQISNEI